MKRRKNKKLVLLLVLVLLISVGYAALASNLKINGTSGVKANTWSVYWNNVQIKDGSVPADNNNKARITDTAKTQVEFNVVLSEPGDYYEFTVDAVNNGTIDAMIDEDGIVNGVYTDSSYTTPATLPKAVSYTVTYADGSEIQDKHLLAKKNGNTPTKETYKVRIEYRNDDEIDPDDLDNDNDHTYYFKFIVNYVQADSTAIDKNASASSIHYVNRQVEGQITPGDVVKIGDSENFYVLTSNSQKTILLAKYNLLVGNITDEWNVVGQVQPSDLGYGLQSVNATGAYANDISSSGNIGFSSRPDSTDSYWDDGYIVSPYNANGASYDGNPYPYVYNNAYNTAPDFTNDGFNTSGYSIAYYVELYRTKLIEMGAPSTIIGRLLSYEEADEYKTLTDNGISIIFDKHQDYWLGSAYGPNWNQAWHIYSDNTTFLENDYDYENFFGVRPVIEIPTSEIK